MAAAAGEKEGAADYVIANNTAFSPFHRAHAALLPASSAKEELLHTAPGSALGENLILVRISAPCFHSEATCPISLLPSHYRPEMNN